MHFTCFNVLLKIFDLLRSLQFYNTIQLYIYKLDIIKITMWKPNVLILNSSMRRYNIIFSI